MNGKKESASQREDLVNDKDFFRSISQQVKDSIIVTNTEFKIIYVNKSTEDLFGYTAKELIGKRPDILNSEPTANEIQAQIYQSVLSNKVWTGIHLNKKKDGMKFFCEMKVSPIENFEGEIIAFIGIKRDITEQMRYQQELKESEGRLRNLVNNITDIIIENDLDGTFLYISPQISEILGYTPEEVIGTNAFSYVHPDDLSMLQDIMRRAIRSKEQINAEYRAIHKNKYYIWISAIGNVINYGDKSRIIAILRDITDQKRKEQEIKNSEEKLKNLINNITDIIIELDLQGNFLFVSSQVNEILGFSPEEVIGTNGFKYIHPEDLKKAFEALQNGISQKKRIYLELKILHKQGHYISVSATGNVVNSKGKGCIIAAIRDITKQKQIEREVRESEDKFRTIAEQSFMGILIIQEDKMEYVNKALLEMFEFSKEEMEGWTKDDLVKLIHPDDLQYLREYRQKLREGISGLKIYYSYRVFTKRGKMKWIDQFTRVISYKSKPAEFVTIMDITEKKEAEQELMRLNNLKNELLRRTSHELKTPLVAIKGFSNLILELHQKDLSDDVKQYIEEIKGGCTRLEGLIQDILDTSKLQSGMIKLEKVQGDLTIHIKEWINELRGLLEMQGHTLHVDLHSHIIIYYEEEQIHKVFTNLLSNAIKYTQRGGELYIKSEIKDESCIISIKDNGIGISEEEKSIIFQQFGKIERYGKGLNIISEGTGLGLYISKKIIELHEGEIWFTSEGREKGATFYFSLPLQKNA